MLPVDFASAPDGRVQFQPSKNLFGMLIWRKDWIENFFNFSCFDKERQSLVQLQPINTKRRQAQSALERREQIFLILRIQKQAGCKNAKKKTPST